MAIVHGQQVLTSLAGVVLFTFGAAGLWTTHAQFHGSTVETLCNAGFCPEEFTPTRLFVLQQEAETPKDAEKIAPLLGRALLQDAASAYRWTDLGAVEMAAGHMDRAHYCFTQALLAAPESPVILFRVANFDWQAGDPQGTLKKLFVVLNNPQLSDLYDSAFLTYSRLSIPIQNVLTEGVPSRPAPVAGFLRFEMAHHGAEESAAIWQWMTAHALATDAIAGEYCSFLMESHQSEAAAETWREFAKADPAYRRSNWTFNPGFENAFRPSPFDWHAGSTAGVIADRTDSTAHNGTHSLRLRFLGRDNAAYDQSFQYVAIPAGDWKLRAAIKTEDLTTNEGIRFHVFDYSVKPYLDVWSDAISGSTDWTTLELVFHSGPAARSLHIGPARQQALIFDEFVRGTAWIDDVELSLADKGAR